MNALTSPMAVAVMGHVESDTVSALTRWIEDQIRHQCARLVLAQKVGETHHPVNEWFILEMRDARSLATGVYETALREAQAQRESVGYAVFPFQADVPGPVGRYSFRIEAGTSGIGAAHTPDERGITAMLMNHTEMSARLSLGHSREIVDQYQTLLVREHEHNSRLLEQAYARIRVLEAREADALEQREELQTRAMERSAALEAQKRSDDRKDEMRKFAMERLGPLLPVVLAKLAGGSPANEMAGNGAGTAGPVGASSAATGSVGDQLIDSLVESMPPDQAKAIASLLTPQQQMLFIQLYELSLARLQRRYSAPEGAPSAPPPSAPTPGAPAGDAPSSPKDSPP